MLLAFVQLHLTLIHLHEIVTILNIPGRARGPDWIPSRAGLWGPPA